MNKKSVRAVTEALRELCVPANVQGFEYLRTAILECLEDDKLIHSITKKMYPLIASEHATTKNRVERSIRHAITLSSRVVPDEVLSKYVSIYRKELLTNGEFIASVVNSIRNEKPDREYDDSDAFADWEKG